VPELCGSIYTTNLFGSKAIFVYPTKPAQVVSPGVQTVEKKSISAYDSIELPGV
jgi:hypothetical protein